MTRHTKIQDIPETEVLTKRTRRSAAVVKAESVEPAEIEEVVHASIVPRKSRKPRQAKKKSKMTVEERLEALSKRYTNHLQGVFADLNSDRFGADFTVSATAAIGEQPGEVWAFCTLSVKETKVCSIAVPILDYPYDVGYIAGVFYLMMEHIGARYADFRGV